jgi:hypothetical protein
LSSPDAQRIADLQQQLDVLYTNPNSHRKDELEAEIKKLKGTKKAPETATAQPKAERAVQPAAKKRTK